MHIGSCADTLDPDRTRRARLVGIVVVNRIRRHQASSDPNNAVHASFCKADMGLPAHIASMRDSVVPEESPADPPPREGGGVIALVAEAMAVDVKGLRFLIVDDDGDQRFLLARTLNGMGVASVVEAGSGRDALAMLAEAEGSVDIIVSDLQMPDIDGMELVRHVGERKIAVSIILVSALDGVLLGSAASMTQAYGVKIIGTIEKPATREKLLAVLANYRAPKTGTGRLKSAAFEPTPEDVLAGIGAAQFEPFFQPIVELATGKVIGAEALGRWRHPTRGVLGPEAFLPPLARAGFMDELSWIMLALTAMEADRWRNAGLRLLVSVNVSGTSLADPGYADAVTQIVNGQGLEPSEMILELTETEAILNVASALENLTRLRMKGFGLAIDDFGVGYSSMQELSRMPFTEIKIDRSFVSAAASNEKSRLMIAQTVGLARQLGMKTVAEGVETRKEWNMLRELGCDMLQGYLIAKPMDGAVFLKWMLGRRARLGPQSIACVAEARLPGA
jgi:EAL domain-containing protein (putative c-di-GMP-specific phosphodiesterase class I)/CheY-like chemotaxis protein